MPMSILKKPEQPRSVNPNVDKEFLEPYKFVEIKNTKHLVIPNGLTFGPSKKGITALVRTLTATGISFNDCVVYGENREEQNVCKKILKVLSVMQEKLLESEYQGELPRPNEGGKLHIKSRGSGKTFLLLQKKDGSFPKKPSNCGSGVLYWGAWETEEEFNSKLSKNRVKRISYKSPLEKLIAITKIQKKYFRI